MGLTVLALTGGLALGAGGLQIGGSNSAQQGSQTTTITAVTGLSWTSTTLNELEANVVNTTCTAPSGCDVTHTPATDCVGALPGLAIWCATGDFVEQVVLTTVAATPFSGVVTITLFVTSGGTTYSGSSFYYTDSPGNSAEPITLDFDIGSATNGPTTVSTVSVVASA